MIWFKACQRCQTGDVHLDEDNSRHCFQCGYIQYDRSSRNMLAELSELLGIRTILTSRWPRPLASRHLFRTSNRLRWKS